MNAPDPRLRASDFARDAEQRLDGRPSMSARWITAGGLAERLAAEWGHDLTGGSDDD